MDAVGWLLVANMAAWLGIGAYVVFLAIAQRKLANGLKHMEMLRHDCETEE